MCSTRKLPAMSASVGPSSALWSKGTYFLSPGSISIPYMVFKMTAAKELSGLRQLQLVLHMKVAYNSSSSRRRSGSALRSRRKRLDSCRRTGWCFGTTFGMKCCHDARRVRRHSSLYGKSGVFQFQPILTDVIRYMAHVHRRISKAGDIEALAHKSTTRDFGRSEYIEERLSRRSTAARCECKTTRSCPPGN